MKRLFSPSFIVWLAESAPDGLRLRVLRRQPLRQRQGPPATAPTELDALCEAARRRSPSGWPTRRRSSRSGGRSRSSAAASELATIAAATISRTEGTSSRATTSCIFGAARAACSATSRRCVGAQRLEPARAGPARAASRGGGTAPARRRGSPSGAPRERSRSARSACSCEVAALDRRHGSAPAPRAAGRLAPASPRRAARRRSGPRRRRSPSGRARPGGPPRAAAGALSAIRSSSRSGARKAAGGTPIDDERAEPARARPGRRRARAAARAGALASFAAEHRRRGDPRLQRRAPRSGARSPTGQRGEPPARSRGPAGGAGAASARRPRPLPAPRPAPRAPGREQSAQAAASAGSRRAPGRAGGSPGSPTTWSAPAEASRTTASGLGEHRRRGSPARSARPGGP